MNKAIKFAARIASIACIGSVGIEATRYYAKSNPIVINRANGWQQTAEGADILNDQVDLGGR